MVRRLRRNVAYSIDSPLQQLAPLVIQATRNPATNDFAEIGTIWVNTTSGAIYMLGRISTGVATWSTSPASGVGVFTSVTVTTGDLDVQAAGSTTTISSATINFDNAAATTTIAGDLTIAGVTTINGDLDLTSASAIDLTATGGQDPAILLQTNGGVGETIQIINSQGTATDAIEVRAVEGEIFINTTNSTAADAIELLSNAGGITVSALGAALNMSSGVNGASAVILEATAGGVDILASGAIAGEDINITATGSSVNISSTENVADSVVISSTVGGIDITATGAAAGEDIDVSASSSINVTSSEAVADAIVLNASNAAGGVQVQAGTAGILIGNQADCLVIDVGDIAPTTSRTITVGGGTVVTAAVTDTIDIGPDGATTNADSIKTVNVNTGGVAVGEVLTNIATGAITSGTHTVSIQSGNAAAGTVTMNLSTGTGTKTVNLGNADGLTTFNMDAITLINDSVNANTSINTGTSTGTVTIGSATAGAIALDTSAGISLDAATASNFTVTGAAQDLTLSSAGGSVNVTSTEAVADAIVVHASDAAGGVQVRAGTGGILIGTDADTTPISVGDVAPSASRTITVGGGQVAAAAVTDTIDIGPDGATTNANSEKIVNINTGALDTGVIAVNIGSGNVASGTHDVNISTGTGTKDVTFGNADGLTDVFVNADFLVNNNINANAQINTGTSTGTILIGNSDAGAITLDTGAGVSIDAATASNFTVTGASQDLTLASTGGSVNVTATEAAADAIVINASNAAGGIDILTGGGEVSIASAGNVTMVPATATAASPTATVVINARVFKATFTGFTTAAGATQDFTITNSAFGVGDGVMG